jgi:hypothetical protein
MKQKITALRTARTSCVHWHIFGPTASGFFKRSLRLARGIASHRPAPAAATRRRLKKVGSGRRTLVKWLAGHAIHLAGNSKFRHRNSSFSPHVKQFVLITARAPYQAFVRIENRGLPPYWVSRKVPEETLAGVRFRITIVPTL